MRLTTSSLFFIVLFCFFSCENTEKTALQFNSNRLHDSLFLKHYKNSQLTSNTSEEKLKAIDSALLSIHERVVGDSLISVLLDLKSKLFTRSSDVKSAITSNDSLYAWAAISKDSSLMAKAKFRQGIVHQNTSNLLDSYQNYQNAFELYKLISDSINMSKVKTNIAILEKEIGDLKGSESTSIEALKLGGSQIKKSTKISNYNNLASTSKDLGDFTEALYWNDKALEISENPSFDIILKGNRYNLYLTQGNYALAAEKLKIFLNDSLLNTRSQKKNYLRQLDHYGEALSHLNSAEAEKILIQVLEGRKELQDLNGIFYSHIHLADHYYRNQNLKDTEAQAEIALSLAKQQGNVDGTVKALSYLIKTKSNPKEEALLYQKLNDSLSKATIEKSNAFAKIKFDAEQNREDNLKLRAESAENALELSKATNRNLWLGGSILLSFGFSFLYYRYTIEKHKKERLKISYDTETKISKRVHDELANDVYNIMTQVQINKELSKEKQDHYLDALEDIYERSRDISRETSIIKTEDFSAELKGLLISYQSSQQRVITKGFADTSWNSVSSYKKVTIYRVLQELMTNYKKHSQARICSIIISEKTRHFEILYTDNGIGMPNNQSIIKNGLQNAENRMDAIKGTLTFETLTGSGLKIKLSFPK